MAESLAAAAASATRIEQFRKMASDDPTNVMAHFSLGRTLLEAGKPAEAVDSFKRVIELDPNISKGYQLLAQAQLILAQRDAAIEMLKRGATIANTRGDLMPKNEMLRQLSELGVEMPELKTQAPAQAVGEGQIVCTRCNRVMPKMQRAPFRNELGQKIQNQICAECWREWIGMGTKVINELRLPMSDPQAQ